MSALRREVAELRVLSEGLAAKVSSHPVRGTRERQLTRVAILWEEDLRKYDAVLSCPDDEAGGWLSRIAHNILRRLFSPQIEIRGHIIAADNLVRALISQGTMNCCDFFCHWWTRSDVLSWINDYRQISSGRVQINIRFMDEVAKGGVGDPRIAAWLNLFPYSSATGGVEVAARIRRTCARELYSITTLFHGLSVHRMLYDTFFRFLSEEILPCDSIVCTSQASARAVNNILRYLEDRFSHRFSTKLIYQGRVDLIPLCVDTVKLRPQEKIRLRVKLKIPANAFVVLSLGRVSPLKSDLYPFLNAFKSLVQHNPGRKLLWIIAGSEDPGYCEALLESAREIGLANHIRILLNISDVEKDLLIPASDVFISFSDSVQESFGLAPVEAMACGIPQVVSNWDGYRDTVRHMETGFLVPTYWTDCSNDLADTGVAAGWAFDHLCLGQSVAVDMQIAQEYLQALIENEQLRNEMAARSRERACSLYSFESIAARYEELWTELSQIACRLDRPLKTVPLDRPSYCDFFRHYASDLLCEEATLRLTPSGEQVTGSQKRLNRSLVHLGGLSILEEKILHRVLVEISERGSQERIRKIIPDLTKTLCRHPDDILRHVMWLIKYGYIQPISDAQTKMQ